MKRRKNPFVLLEIAIALAILSLLVLPFVAGPIKFYQKEIRSLKEVAGERLADLTFIEVKEALLRHEIPWEKLPGPDEEKGPFELLPAEVDLGGKSPTTLRRYYALACWKKKEKKGEDGLLTRLLEIKIFFDPPLKERHNSEYRYRALVQKQPLAP